VDRWRNSGRGVEPLELNLPQGRIRCWASGLSTRERKPLLILMGGIVTVKEQWAPTLVKLGRLGMAGIVTELPGVGENEQRYTAGSHRMVTDLLDALADRADVSQTYAIAMSFSGHLALRCAVDDQRLRGVITTGAPIREFFTDTTWQRGVPRITIDTLAHLIGVESGSVEGNLTDWALTDDHLAALGIPVAYMASLRDEIIPPGEVALLRNHLSDLDIREYDDVHGAPRHTAETQLWSISALLRARGVHNPQSALLGLMLGAMKLRRQVGARNRPLPVA
jgi:pimeloyl-ACP methyl ester carboxylesterase